MNDLVAHINSLFHTVSAMAGRELELKDRITEVEKEIRRLSLNSEGNTRDVKDVEHDLDCFKDSWKGDLGQAVQYIKQLVEEIHSALYKDGSPEEVHPDVRAELDETFAEVSVLRTRIDDLVDLATAIERGRMKLTGRIKKIEKSMATHGVFIDDINTRIKALEKGMVHRNALDTLAERIEALESRVDRVRESGASRMEASHLSKRIDDLESRVDRVQESAVDGINANTNHLSKRIDDLVDLATAIEGGQTKQADRIEQIENHMASRVALDVLAQRIEDLENPNRETT